MAKNTSTVNMTGGQEIEFHEIKMNTVGMFDWTLFDNSNKKSCLTQISLRKLRLG